VPEPLGSVPDNCSLSTSLSPARARTLTVWTALAGAALAIGPTWSPLFDAWHRMTDYSHCDLVLLWVIAWLCLRSTKLPAPASRFSFLGVTLLLASLSVWLIAYRSACAIGEQLLAPVVLWSAVLTSSGWPIALRMAAPILALYLVIPAWEFLLPTLQAMTVDVSQTLLGWIDIPVQTDGALVTIPEGTFRIAEGCAGKRYLIVSVTASVLYAASVNMRPTRRALFLLVAAMLAVSTNWLRVTVVILAGHMTNMTSYLVAREHISFGWALFACLVVMLGMVGRCLSTRGPAQLSPALDPSTENGPNLTARCSLPATMVLLCIPVAAEISAKGVQGAVVVPNLPASAAGTWRGPLPAPDPAWIPDYRGASASTRDSYRGPNGDAEVFMAEYLTAEPGAKLISSANRLFPDEWRVVHDGRLEVAQSRLGHVRKIWAVAPDNERWIVSYVYQVGTIVTINPIVAQLAYGVFSWREMVPSRVVAVAGRCSTTQSCEARQTELVSFWNTFGSSLLRQ